MIARLRHDWVAWLLCLGALLALLGPISLLLEVGQPFGGYVTFHRAASMLDEVDGNTPFWWSGLQRGRALHGDSLVAVDSVPHGDNAREAYAQAFTIPSATAQVELARGDAISTVTLPVTRFTLLQFFDLRLPDLVTGLVLWLAAVIVYLAKPDQAANRAFAVASAIAGYSRVMYVHTLFFDSTFAVGSELFLQFLLAFLGPAIFFLAICFPKRAESKWAQPILSVMLAAGVVSIACAVYSRIGDMPLDNRLLAQRTGYLLTILLLYVGLAVLFGRLISWYVKSNQSRRDKRVAIILLVGWTLALPPIIASGLNAFTAGQGVSFYFLNGLDLRYMLLFAPLAFAFVLIRYHAMQAPSSLFIFVMVVATSALVAALIAWIWTLTQPNWLETQVQPPFLSLFTAALLIGLFWTTYARMPGVLGRSLVWDRYSSVSAREFGRRIGRTTDLMRAPEMIAQAVVDEFELEQCALWLAEPDGSAMRLAAHAGDRQTDLPDTVSLAQGSLTSTSHPFRPADVVADDGLWAPLSLEARGIEVVVPLAVESRLLGVLGLGPRWDEDVFDTRNLDIFEIVGQQATLLLAVNQNVQELQQVPGRMADAQDRERLRLAGELHDTVQQFLGRLPFYLAVSRDSMSTDPVQATELLNRSITDVEEAAVAVRQLRHNLAPSQLERGLASSLVTLTTNFQRRTGLAVTLTCSPDLDDATNLVTRHAIYRVIQQALDNVEALRGCLKRGCHFKHRRRLEPLHDQRRRPRVHGGGAAAGARAGQFWNSIHGRPSGLLRWGA